MAIVVTVTGTLIAAIGVFGVTAPARLMKLVDRFRGGAGVWAAAGIRLVVGIAFVLAAPACRWPDFVLVVGIIALLAAVGLPIMGQRRFDAFVAWWMQRPPVVIRGWALVATAFGGLLAYAGGWPS